MHVKRCARCVHLDPWSDRGGTHGAVYGRSPDLKRPVRSCSDRDVLGAGGVHGVSSGVEGRSCGVVVLMLKVRLVILDEVRRANQSVFLVPTHAIRI